MKNQLGMNAGPLVSTEPNNAWVCYRYGELQEEVTNFAAQLAALEQEYARSNALTKALGRAFGFGAGKLEWARFKLSYKREQLAEFESQYLVNNRRLAS